MRGRIGPVEVGVDGQAHRVILGGSDGRGLLEAYSRGLIRAGSFARAHSRGLVRAGSFARARSREWG